MQMHSATDAISPAIARTKLLLYSPFRLGRTWKLSATAYLSFAGTVFLPFMIVYAVLGLAIPGLPAVARTIVVAVGTLLTALYAVFFWLCGHLKFAFFDMVLNAEKLVAPAWRRCTHQARSWTGVKMLFGTAFTAITAVPAYAAVRSMLPTFAALRLPQNDQTQPGIPPEFVNIMLAFYGAYFLAFVVVGIYFLVLSTASSFMVPVMLLENATVGAAWRRFVSFARRERSQLVAFVVVRFGLAFAGYFALMLAYEVVFLVIAAVAALVCGCIGLVLHLAHVPTPVLLMLGGIAFGLLVTVVNGYLLCLALGPFFTFFEAHTLYFLGGRYPLLGERLERSTPPVPAAGPSSYYPQHYAPPTA